MNIRLKLVLSAAALAAGCVLLAGCGLTDEKITMKPETLHFLEA